jgi:hypothetical protein
MVHWLDFSPDDQTIVSGGEDGSAYVWDVTGVRDTAPQLTDVPSAASLELFWANLADADAVKAHRALWTLASRPRLGIAVLDNRLRTALKKSSCPDVSQLIRRLDDNDFRIRQSATEELEKLGTEVIPSVEAALTTAKSLESRRRLDAVLLHLESAPIEAHELRLLRAIRVLEHIGQPEARQLLTIMGRSAPEGLLAKEADAALRRLAHEK